MKSICDFLHEAKCDHALDLLGPIIDIPVHSCAVRFQLEHGDIWCWLVEDVVCREPASSIRDLEADKMPCNIKVFSCYDAAKAFMGSWKGHPWWNLPNGQWETVAVKPRVVQDGWLQA